MKTGGWTFMILTWGAITAVLVGCYYRVITDKPDKKEH